MRACVLVSLSWHAGTQARLRACVGGVCRCVVGSCVRQRYGTPRSVACSLARSLTWQADPAEWQNAYDRVQILQDSVSQKEAKLRDMAETMEETRNRRNSDAAAASASAGGGGGGGGGGGAGAGGSRTPRDRPATATGYYGSSGGDTRPMPRRRGSKGNLTAGDSDVGRPSSAHGYHHDGGATEKRLTREEMMSKVNSVAKMRGTVQAHRRGV